MDAMAVQIERRKFTVSDYARMIESGILGEDDKIELIDGEIRQMAPVDSVHTASVKRLNRLLMEQLGQRFIIGVQDPIRLNDLNEPQPDLSVLHWHDDFYEQQHPMPGDVLILVEVANTSLAYDRAEKLPRYAAAGIPEVWLVDVAHRTVEQYAQPVNGQYAQRAVLSRDMVLQSSAVSDFELDVNRIFGL
ncbi:MAG: Uma2 family endonuclease [Caldilineaceae bacterium]|nr:Uma2 family endonuclease [Caldilineaceae bacterium]